MIKHYLFIGMPGSGKTTMGLQFAQQQSLPFIDLDQWIEATYQSTIKMLFEKYGEAGFREIEWKSFNKLIAGDSCVIAGGGGLVSNAIQKGYAKPEMIRCILLNPNIERLKKQLLREGELSKRPLLLEATNLDHKIEALMNERMPAYQAWADEVWVNY